MADISKEDAALFRAAMIDSSTESEFERAIIATAKGLGEKNAELRTEIERLRAALERIASCDPYLEHDCRLAAIAREALKD